MDMTFYKGKRVLITGHTGFKGSWLCHILNNLGAKVTGYACEPPTIPNLFHIINLENKIQSIIGDIRDYKNLLKVFEMVKPEIVIHLAAQPIVRTAYENPKDTYEINVMGTVNLCECIRKTDSVYSFLNVTTDKVYEDVTHRQKEWVWGYREDDPLDGFDPYSNSKSCSELVTHSYINSFFQYSKTAVSTARAGNVIGGGDFARDRIIPDCIRSAIDKKKINVRNPKSIRPYQHVLEPLFAYLLIIEQQYQNKEKAGFFNVGPDDNNCITTGELVSKFCQAWGEQLTWNTELDSGPVEASFLKLDCSKIKQVFSWKPKWDIDTAICAVVDWTKAYIQQDNVIACMDKQISNYMK